MLVRLEKQMGFFGFSKKNGMGRLNVFSVCMCTYTQAMKPIMSQQFPKYIRNSLLRRQWQTCLLIARLLFYRYNGIVEVLTNQIVLRMKGISI